MASLADGTCRPTFSDLIASSASQPKSFPPKFGGLKFLRACLMASSEMLEEDLKLPKLPEILRRGKGQTCCKKVAG